MIIVQAILWILLIVSVVLLIAVILLQEGKGGGLAEAFGGAGAETFGVKAAGINKFTSIVGGAFLAICILLTIFKLAPSEKPLVKPEDMPNFGPPRSDVVRPPPPANPPKKSDTTPANKPGGSGAPADSNGKGDKPADKSGGGGAPAEPPKKDGGP